MDEYKGSPRGWGPWRRNWYSICSRHRRYVYGCKLCETGQYVWIVRHRLSSLMFWLSPRLWRWWHNRPNSRSRKFLEEVFPSLKNVNQSEPAVTDDNEVNNANG